MYGLLAQLVERLVCTEEVKGSNPLESTIKIEISFLASLAANNSSLTVHAYGSVRIILAA